MSEILQGATMRLLAELAEATSEIIERHWERDERRTEPTLKYQEFFRVEVHTGDGPRTLR